MRILVGTASESIGFAAVDSSNPMLRKTGVSSWTVYYSKDGGASTQLVTPTITEVDATNMAGDYLLVLTSAMLDTAGELVVHIKASGVGHITRVIDVWSPTVIQAACEDAINAKFTFTGFDVKATLDSETVTVATNNDKTGYALSSAGIDTLWQENISAHGGTGTCYALINAVVQGIVGYLGTDNKVKISTDNQDLSTTLHVDAKAVGGSTIAATSVVSNISNLDAAISSRSSHNAAAVTGGTTVAGAVTAIKGANGKDCTTITTDVAALNNLTSANVTTACETSIANKFSFILGDVVATLNSEEVTTDAASRTASKADVSGLATSTALGTLSSTVDDIKTKTDQLNFVDDDVKATLFNEEVTTDAASRTASKADVSGLATSSALSTIGTTVDGIANKTVNLPPDPADQSAVEAYVLAVGNAIAVEVNANEAKIDAIDAAVGAIKTNTDNWPLGFKRNTAYSNFLFVMSDTDGVPTAGLTVTAQRSLDGASLTSCTNAVTEVSNGIYKINLSSADLDAEMVAFRFTAAGAGDSVIIAKTET